MASLSTQTQNNESISSINGHSKAPQPKGLRLADSNVSNSQRANLLASTVTKNDMTAEYGEIEQCHLDRTSVPDWGSWWNQADTNYYQSKMPEVINSLRAIPPCTAQTNHCQHRGEIDPSDIQLREPGIDYAIFDSDIGY